MDTAVEVYALTGGLPKEELFGMTAQLRRAAVSIPTNVAEGSARRSRKEFHHFVSIAIGSQAELKTLLTLVDRLYPSCETKTCRDAVDRIGMMLVRLRQSLAKAAAANT